MTTGNPDFGNVLTSTFQDIAKDLADNYTENTGLLDELNKAGNVKTCEGGDLIGQNLEIDAAGSYIRYSGMQEWDLTQNKFLTRAQFAWKQVACPVVFSGLEIDVKNSGSAKRRDLMSTKIKNARKTFKNNMATDVYSDGSLTNQIGGLAVLVANDSTTGTVGGIDRSTNTFWRNATNVNTGTAWDSTTIEGVMEDMYLDLTRNADKPNLITSDNTMYSLYWNSQEGKRRYASMDRNGGATELMFNNVKVIADGGQSGKAPTGTMYFLNLDYLYLRPSSNRNVVSIGKRVSLNQDAYVDGIMWAGNMTVSNPSLSGVLVNA